MKPIEQQRHKPPATLTRPRALIIACPPMRSNVNLSKIVRAAGCCGVRRVIACGTARLAATVARDATDQIQLELHRTLPPVLAALRREGFQIVALEQTNHSLCLHDFVFERETVLVVGNERTGISEEVLAAADRVVEIPVWGLPAAHNAATAAAMAMYEYCRQFPQG